MELMQKYPKEKGEINVDNLICWPSDFPAISFLSDIIFAILLNDLIKVNKVIGCFEL